LDISFALPLGKSFRTHSYPEDTIDIGCQV
jgi:hypothetical protein